MPVKAENKNNDNLSDSDVECDVFVEDPVRKVLRGIENVSDEIIEKIRQGFCYNVLSVVCTQKIISIHYFILFFRNSNVFYRNLSALDKEDLKLFGIIDVAKQNEILVSLASCPKQLNHFDKLVLSFDRSIQIP